MRSNRERKLLFHHDLSRDTSHNPGLYIKASSSPARRCRQAQRERCGRAPAGSVTRSAARCTDRRNCSSRRRGTTPRAAPEPECTAIGAPGGAAARCPPEAPAASGCGRERRARCGGCALPPDGPAASGSGRERPSSCATPARFAGEGALQPRSTAASAVGMLWSAGGVGRGAGTVPCAPGSAADFAAEVAVSSAVADRLARTGVLPPQASRPGGRGGSAAPAKVPAPPIPRAGSSADRAAGASPQPPSSVSLPKDRAGCSVDRAAGAGVQPPALVPCRRQRHSGLLLRAPLRWRSRPACRPCRRIRFRRLRCMRLWRLARACLPAPASAPAPRSPRVVALQAVLHQPLHQLPQRQVRVHVRQQCA